MANTTATGSGKVSVMHQSSISIEVTGNQGDSSNIVRLKPALGGAVETGVAAIKVSTNLPGYNLVIKDADEETALVSSTDDMYTIPAGVPEQGSSAWGYRVDDAKGWNTISTTSTLVKNRDTVPPEGGDLTLVTFGVSLNSKQMEGTYTDEVLFIVAANDAPSVPPTPEEEPTLSNLAYMQDMTPEICSRSSEHETKQLIDKRDGKRYWIAKLKDGNCWMVQNLGLTFGTGNGKVESLEPTLSDVVSNWTPPATTMSVPTGKGSSDQNGLQSWNLGKIVLKNPTGSQNCPQPTPPAGYDADGYNSVYPGQTLEGNCPQYFQKVDGLSDSYEATPTSSISADGRSYDAHYLIGNYYQWNTATAGSGASVGAAGDATSSICPKGWGLPTNAKNVELVKAYGYTGEGGQSITAGTNRVDYNPIYTVRSGAVLIKTGVLRVAGQDGAFWTSSAKSSDVAIYFAIAGGIIYPSGTGSYWSGFPVRCVNK